jgi:hypothetical protein
MRWLSCVLCLAAAPPVSLLAQSPLVLSKPDGSYAEPFTQLASIRELRDGRVLVLDRRDRIVLLLDLAKGTARQVGREGTGPGEYTQPGRLFAFPGDTTAIYDGPARRFVLVRPDGTMGDAFRLDLATGGGQRRGGVPKYSDARGRIFTEGSPFAGELQAADSTPITRFDRAGDRGDTLAYVHLDKESITVRTDPRGGVNVSNGMRAFALRDDWTALPDGGIAVVRVSDYHVDWFSPGGDRVSSPAVKHERIAVTEADKERFRKALLATMRAASPRNGNNNASSPPATMAGLPELTFPASKPPFEVGNVLARPNGEVWALRSRRANDEVAVYDVFTRGAGLIGRVAFPPRTTIIGFGNTTVYAVRLDDDDLQYLERWTLPYATRLWAAPR